MAIIVHVFPLNFCIICSLAHLLIEKGNQFSLTTEDIYFITGRNEVVAKVIFLHLSFCSRGGGGFSLAGAGGLPGRTPPCQGEPPRTRGPHPPGLETPTPWDQRPTPRDWRPPQTRHTPPEADASIRSMSGRYASYWNAFLFFLCCQQKI